MSILEQKMKREVTFIMLILLGGMLLSGALFGEDGPSGQASPRRRPAVSTPAVDEKTHDVGQLFFTVSNWGFFGSQRGEDDPRYCIIYQAGPKTGQCRPAAEYPGGSGLEYLFQGALWIGAVVAGDTLVSVGEDGWFHDVNELLPGYNQATDTIMINSIYLDSLIAISEQDFEAIMTDTVKNPNIVPTEHRPIGVEVRQRSVSWSYNYARNFVIIDYWFRNIREERDTIRDAYVGIYIDGDVGHVNTPQYAQDDVTGFVQSYWDPIKNDSIVVNTAWLADNDGDPTNDGRFDEYSPTGALGIALLKVGENPLDELTYSYNWWVSNTNEDIDWGPMHRYPPMSWDGTPETDIMKYQVMSNGEFDYNQTDILNYRDHPDWVPPPSDLAENMRCGYDTRFLFSFGPFDILPDDTMRIAIAVMVAEDFHQDPNVVGDCQPEKFNYAGVGKTTQWVRDVYGAPNGLGVPNYQGPVPPPKPYFEVETYDNKIDIYWKFQEAMNFTDPITLLKDFAGFRIYTAEANLESYYVPIIEFDKVLFTDYNSLDTFQIQVRTDEFLAPEDFSPGTFPTLDTTYTWDGGEVVVDVFPRKKFGTNSGLPEPVMRNGEEWFKYTLTNQRAGSDIYISVTAYDYGQPTRDLESLESSKTTNYKWVVPVGSGETSKEVYVIPNPYRVDNNYAGAEGLDWETPVGQVWTEYSRKIRFANLPPRCIIRIYTVDGDLVDEMTHSDDGFWQGGKDNKDSDRKDMVGAEDWDLINKNDQAIASGIYMFSVENAETGEYQLGKFVIIK
jgi:hypothetical protein